jgi:hypothetical protein
LLAGGSPEQGQAGGRLPKHGLKATEQPRNRP